MNNRIFKDNRFLTIMLSGLAWGIFAHGMALFNKYSYHDDVPWFNGVGETYGLGRWFLGFAGKYAPRFFGSRNYSTPVYCGFLTLAAIVLMVYIVSLKLRIERPSLLVALTGVLICFPAVTNIFGYVFTAPYYYIGALLGVIGAYVYYTHKNVATFILCTFLMALSVGLYQSNIAINLMVLLLFMLSDVYESEMKWKEYITLAAGNAGICACFMAEYFAFNALFLKIEDMQMYDYKGVGSFGRTSVSGYIYRIYTAYKRFIKPADYINYNGVSANMFPWGIKYFHMILVVIIAVLMIFLARTLSSRAKIIQLAILTAISPLFAYFIYVMVAEEDAHGGMGFGEAFMFFLAAFVIQRISENGEASDEKKYDVSGILTKAAVGLFFVIAFMSARFANVCYLKAEVMQAEAISYYNTLIARIQMTDGYTADTPVAYIGERSKDDSAFVGAKLFEPIYLPPYQGNSIINDFAWEETMHLWCGFSPESVNAEDLSDQGAIDEMSVYPAAGSVKMVDGTIVVKFAE